MATVENEALKSRGSTPRVSVLLPAYNSEQYILQSVQSVLSQTYRNFELIVVNDASTDSTARILEGIADSRIRLLHNAYNLGIVGSLNRAMAIATGEYIARIDADDFCLPTRLEKQTAYLDKNPETAIVGTEMSVLSSANIGFSRQLADQDPKILKWMLYISNPLGHPSMMFRADAITRLGEYLREDYRYAEDFDFSHRVLRYGNISVLPEHLVIYRKHIANLTRTGRSRMVAKTAQVLARVYSELLGQDHAAEAELVAEYISGGGSISDPEAVKRLGNFLNVLLLKFCTVNKLNDFQIQKVTKYTGKMWWEMIRASLRAGHLGAFKNRDAFRWSAENRPSSYRIGRSTLSGIIFNGRTVKPETVFRKSESNIGFAIGDTQFREVRTPVEEPPRLYVVVDTEAEFNWNAKFDRSLTSVKSIERQFLAQSIFDKYGVRPIYVLDYAVASQKDGIEPLLEMFNSHRCAIGAHLHPWINPPFEEVVSDRNSFGGNLPIELEERKLRALVSKIEESFGISPLFFKAGRYGIGKNTMATLEKLGFAVDFSIMPLSDLRTRGGPDYRAADGEIYHSPGLLKSIPMTRGQIGIAAPLPIAIHSAVRKPFAIRLHIPGILARLNLANTVTLTPEGVSAAEQIKLVRSLLGRGRRIFVLHYHSPSLSMHTPYVRSKSELTDFVQRIKTLCEYFFGEVGGLPGNPADLVPQCMRNRVWKPSEIDVKSMSIQSNS